MQVKLLALAVAALSIPVSSAIAAPVGVSLRTAQETQVHTGAVQKVWWDGCGGGYGCGYYRPWPRTYYRSYYREYSTYGGYGGYYGGGPSYGCSSCYRPSCGSPGWGWGWDY